MCDFCIIDCWQNILYCVAWEHGIHFAFGARVTTCRGLIISVFVKKFSEKRDKNMGELKHKKDNADETMDDGTKESYEEKLSNCSQIAVPMAPKKLTKKIYKCIKKASKHKTYLRNGLKDVQKHLRKGEKGIVIFAGDVFPIEIMCHLPIVCEDKDIPYAFVPSKQDIGTAMGVKRGSLMVLIKCHDDYKDIYAEVTTAIKTLSTPL